MSDARTANLLGAAVTALNDELEAATASAAEHGAALYWDYRIAALSGCWIGSSGRAPWNEKPGGTAARWPCT
jgi:hypothetical protein